MVIPDRSTKGDNMAKKKAKEKPEKVKTSSPRHSKQGTFPKTIVIKLDLSRPIKKTLTKRLREEEDEEDFELFDHYLAGIDSSLIEESLRLDKRRLRMRKKHGDYVV